MNNSAVVCASPEYYAALDKVAEGLGAAGDKAEQQKKKAQKQVRLYAVPEIIAYLEARFPEEEAIRQSTERRTSIVTSILLVYAITGLYLLNVRFPASRWYVIPYLLPALLFNIVSGVQRSRSASPVARHRGMVHLLTDFGGRKQVPLLIDALWAADSRSAVKHRLSNLLPLYLQGDEPSLSDRRKRLLTRHLRESFQEIVTRKCSFETEANVSFMVAVLIYFERELAQGRSVPKEVVPVLKRFAGAKHHSQVSVPQWNMLQTATQECLVSLGATK